MNKFDFATFNDNDKRWYVPVPNPNYHLGPTPYNLWLWMRFSKFQTNEFGYLWRSL